MRVSVDLNLEDVIEYIGNDELLDELESRNITLPVVEEAIEEAKRTEDRIHLLMEDFINWHQFGMSNENFEKSMKQFFLDTIDEYIS